MYRRVLSLERVNSILGGERGLIKKEISHQRKHCENFLNRSVNYLEPATCLQPTNSSIKMNVNFYHSTKHYHSYIIQGKFLNSVGITSVTAVGSKRELKTNLKQQKRKEH